MKVNSKILLFCISLPIGTVMACEKGEHADHALKPKKSIVKKLNNQIKKSIERNFVNAVLAQQEHLHNSFNLKNEKPTNIIPNILALDKQAEDKQNKEQYFAEVDNAIDEAITPENLIKVIAKENKEQAFTSQEIKYGEYAATLGLCALSNNNANQMEKKNKTLQEQIHTALSAPINVETFKAAILQSQQDEKQRHDEYRQNSLN